MSTLLYVALADLTVSSVIATWKAPAGSVLPLDPSKASTIALLAAGQIEPAASDAVDDTTPANVLRGQPGIKAPGTVSN